MSSNLKVNNILPSTGTNIGLGTASGTLNVDGGCKVQVGTALTLGHTQGVQFHTQNLHSEGFEINQVNASGIITASSFSGSVAATNLTGTIPDARISASSVTQHVTAFDDNNIINDISILALKVSALENSAASNTNSTYVDTFQDAAGISNFSTSSRDSSGEYISSVFDVVTNISAGWKGGGNQNTGTDAANATSYTGYDGVSRSKGQIVGNSNFSGYNTFNLGHIFGASDNFEVIFNQRGNWHALYRLHGNLGSNMSAIGTYRSEPGYSLGSAFSSHMGGLTMAGAYPAPTGSNFDGTTFYRFYRLNNSMKITYYNSVSDVSLNSTILNDLRTSTSYVPNSNGFGKPTNITQHMLLGMGEGGTTSHMKIEMANTFAPGLTASGSVTSVTINAPSTVSKMGVVVTYIDTSGTATLNTDLKLYLSANNGSNFTQVTLAALPLFATGVKMAKANDVTISNTGTQLKWKVEFANQSSGSKETRVTGVSLQY